MAMFQSSWYRLGRCQAASLMLKRRSDARLFARREIGRKELLEAEAKSYHGPGTCTFYGTANSNQMLMEVMGLHLPGAAFEHPHSDPASRALC